LQVENAFPGIYCVYSKSNYRNFLTPPSESKA